MKKILQALTFALALIHTGSATAAGVSWPAERQRGANITLNLTRADVEHLARDWKANSVRLLVNDLVPSQPPHKVDPEELEKIYALIDLCLEYGLYTVFSPSPAFNDNDLFFSSEEYMAAYLEFWKQFAANYAANRGGVAYDLMNEPHDKLALTAWLPYAKKLTAAIRSVDTLHTIVVEPPEWGWPRGFKGFETTGDHNTVYSFNFYGPMDFTHQRNRGMLKATEEQWRERFYPGGTIEGEKWDRERVRSYLQDAFDFREHYGARVWCGEFGCTRWAIGALDWFRDMVEIMEAEQVGWNYYAYREWYPMDIEMNPAARLERTQRTETELVKFFKKYFFLDAGGR
ncbi:MAG TPA: cellulase family glycosylhydrolase [Candidatus Glassbacteria bacterium]|nr:cellulase family glycosylhydrolase [Candidatus Glassbacteria bacterium]